MTRAVRFPTAIAIICMFLVACAGAPPPVPPTAQPQATPTQAALTKASASQPSGNPILIGATLGLTGQFAGPSAVYKGIYEYWQNKVNGQGGLLGRPVKIIIYDDEAKPATAQALVQRLIKEDKVDLLLAPFATGVGGAVIPIAEANQMVLWNGGFVGIDLFKKSNWMVGSWTMQEPDYTRSVFEMIAAMPADQRPKRLGILTGQTPSMLVDRDGYNGYGGALGFAKQYGLEVLVNEEYPTSISDATALVQKAKAANVDMFLTLSGPNDAALIAKTAKEQGFKPKVYCSCGSQVTTLPYWKDVGPAGEGVMSTTLSWPTDKYKDMQEVFDYTKTKLGYAELPAYATVALTILQIMQQAVAQTGTLDQKKLREYVLSQKTFDTINGPLLFNSDGTPQYNAILVQFIGGHNEVVWPANRASAKYQFPSQ